jgi:hypothetical protein
LIVNRWPAWFRNLYGGEWPHNYVCFDIETTGYSFKQDVITEIGHCLVQDGKIVDELTIVLDWTNHDIVPDAWLRRALTQVQNSMAASGRRYHITYEKMQADGMEPEKALAFYRDLFETFKSKDMIFASHGGYVFDETMISANFTGFGIDAKGFHLGDNNMLCTDGLEKATQIPDHPRVQVVTGDTLRSYFHRVRYTNKAGIKSNLDTHCFNKYDFAHKYGMHRRDLHGAGPDCRCVHYLMEEYRSRITPATVQVPVLKQVAEPTAASVGAQCRQELYEERRDAREANRAAERASRRFRGQRNN